MFTFTCVHDKKIIEEFYKQNPEKSIYELGDLDKFYWNKTIWYAFSNSFAVENIALVYCGTELPVLLLQSRSELSDAEICRSLVNYLPNRIYAHLDPGLDRYLRPYYSLASHGKYWKMLLQDKSIVRDCAEAHHAVRLDRSILPDTINDFYERAYPGNWFDLRMLDTGEYWGIFDDGHLVSAGGVHVYSKQYRVAALGNIATLAEMRGKGLGRTVTAAVCQSLLQDMDIIGLNVRQDNASAIACYKGLGFEIVDEYEEFMLDHKSLVCKKSQ